MTHDVSVVRINIMAYINLDDVALLHDGQIEQAREAAAPEQQHAN